MKKTFKEKYENILPKYNHLLAKNKAMKEVINQFNSIGTILTSKNSLMYLRKWGDAYYLEFPNLKKEHCYVCEKKKKTTAHHIIPKRAKCKNEILKEVRVRVCRDCDKQIHPENRIISESEALKMAQKHINNLQDAIYWRSMKLNTIEQKMKSFGNMIKSFDEFIAAFTNLKDEDFYRKSPP